LGYVGNSPAEKYASFAVQHFTTSATTGYTLDHAVANENDIRLVINNVVQQPGGSYAYTATGTTLTLSAATSGTDTMYCVFLGKAVQTVNPPAASVGTSQLADSSVTNVKLGSDINATKLSAGLVPTARLGSGTASSSTFLAGDQTYKTVSDTNGLVLIERIQATGDIASIAFNSKFTTTYTKYMLYIGQCSNDTDAQDFRLRYLNSSDAELTGGHYTYGMEFKNFGNGTTGGDHGIGQTQFALASGHNGSDNTPHFGQYFIYNNSQTDATDRPMMTGTGIWHHEADHDPRGFYWGGSYSGGEAIHGLKLYASSGDLSDYDVSLFGIKDT
tara:strand:+ start:137 stop:1126 length:990 start_codon:yes stop_codon:yes gene_type:complete